MSGGDIEDDQETDWKNIEMVVTSEEYNWVCIGDRLVSHKSFLVLVFYACAIFRIK